MHFFLYLVFTAPYRDSGQANVSFRVPPAGWIKLNGGSRSHILSGAKGRGGRVFSCSKTTDLAVTAWAVTANEQNANFPVKNTCLRCQTQPSRCLQLLGTSSVQTFSNTCRKVISLKTLPPSITFTSTTLSQFLTHSLVAPKIIFTRRPSRA